MASSGTPQAYAASRPPFTGISAPFTERPARAPVGSVLSTGTKAGNMKRTHNVVFNLASVASLLTAGVAAMTIWLLLAQPLNVANAVNTGDVSGLVRALGPVLSSALEAILKYL